MTTQQDREELKPCPFCGAGTSEIVENGKVWTGMKYGEPSSVSVRHHCEPTQGQPSRMLERVGKDRASAIAAWNTRADLLAEDGRAGGEVVAWGMRANGEGKILDCVSPEQKERGAPQYCIPLYTHPQPAQVAQPLTVPFDVEFAAAYLDGVMEVEQPEIQSKWAKVRAFLIGIKKDQP